LRARHIRTGRVYDVVHDDARMRLSLDTQNSGGDGRWGRGWVVYRVGSSVFVRSRASFDDAFELLEPTWGERITGWFRR
jgi:hypothetical protein